MIVCTVQRIGMGMADGKERLKNMKKIYIFKNEKIANTVRIKFHGTVSIQILGHLSCHAPPPPHLFLSTLALQETGTLHTNTEWQYSDRIVN